MLSRKRPVEMMSASPHRESSNSNILASSQFAAPERKRKRLTFQKFKDRNDENVTTDHQSRKRRACNEMIQQHESKKRAHMQQFHSRQQKRSFEHAQDFSSRKRCRLQKDISENETRLYSQMEVNNIKQEHYAEIIRLRNELRVVKQQKIESSSATRAEQENAILKRGLNIQQQKLENAENVNSNLKHTVQMLMIQNERLQAENNMLRAEIGSSCSSSSDFFRRMPPGVH